MKAKLLTLFAALGLALAAHAQNVKMTLGWDYPPDMATNGVGFHIYTSTNASTPLRSWQLLLDVPSTALQPLPTNGVVTTYIAGLSVSRAVHYFYVTAYTQWGESDPSNMGTPGSPPVPVNSRFLP